MAEADLKHGMFFRLSEWDRELFRIVARESNITMTDLLRGWINDAAKELVKDFVPRDTVGDVQAIFAGQQDEKATAEAVVTA